MLYRYEAADKHGAIIKGEFEALGKDAVVEYLTRKNLIPLSVEEKGAVKQLTGLSFSIFERITPLDRIIFVRNLAATVKAGLNMLESLEILIADTTKKMMRNILVQAKINLENGQPLSATFYSFRKYFPIVFVGMLKAGEASGKLETTLDELSVHLTREYNLTRKVRSALAYPFILFVASIAVITLLLLFVLPRLAKTFRQSGAELPLITKVLVAISNFLIAHPFIDIFALVAVIWFFAYFRKTRVGRRVFLQIIFHIPIAKELVKKIALVRFTRSLGSLISSGTSILEALHLAADSVGNEDYKKAVLESVEQVKSGVPFSKTLQNYPELFPRFLTSLIAVGERTGTLEHILKTFADFYDDEVDNALKDLTTFLEPLLLLFMGLVIGSIALSILLPIYQLVGKFT